MSIFEKGQEFLTKNSYYQPRKERDELDDSIAHFCNVVHAMLTGKAKEELAIPYEERDAEFINKYPSFTLSKCLGRGQAGVVFLGEDDDGNPIFAIKVIHLPGAVGAGLPIRRTFLIYQNVLKMIRHPNINQYLGWTVVDNEAQVYTAFCNNGSLTSKIMQDKNDPGIKDIVQLKSYLKQILFGLSYLHSHGIVHRDLKPGNVLLHDGICRITDLGSARIQQTCCEIPHQTKLSGTAAYCSPEGIKSNVMQNHAAEDIWSLGCCLFEMVMGRTPWSECDNQFAIYYTVGNLNTNTDHLLIQQLIESKRLNANGIQFARDCLQVDPRSRPTVFQLVQHVFLQ